MRSRAELVGAMLRRNNARVRRVDPRTDNPRDVAGTLWHARLVAAHPAIRAEWEAFEALGGDLPLIEEVLGRPDQNQGSYWRFGPLLYLGRGIQPFAQFFPQTIAALRQVPMIRSAAWSVLGPGGWIPEHVGPNGGSLRLLVAVDAEGAQLRVNGAEARFRDGHGTLFDDTYPHAVRNDGGQRRVVLLCDVTRRLPLGHNLANRSVLRTLQVASPAYLLARRRAVEHFARRNPQLVG